jgi:hypothetical protein
MGGHIRVDFKQILSTRNYVDFGQERDYRISLVNTASNFRVPKSLGVSYSKFLD